MRIRADFHVGDPDDGEELTTAEAVRAATATIVDKIGWGMTSGVVRDVNGNTVGTWELYGPVFD